MILPGLFWIQNKIIGGAKNWKTESPYWAGRRGGGRVSLFNFDSGRLWSDWSVLNPTLTEGWEREREREREKEKESGRGEIERDRLGGQQILYATLPGSSKFPAFLDSAISSMYAPQNFTSKFRLLQIPHSFAVSGTCEKINFQDPF